ncbi:hypothetical protein SELMODRAFT_182646 [Selaginella moellendorffii]|uniref:Fatty acid hydroxylase domain-containing protein n=1 Tax=Selaginella moellendorffii TaxID=88036 RepID=D8STY9_SELML|nr:delta(7)-sterol-C5(6)-desaturase [Selaginella moellendorffii]XP_024516461.1 delta(7)-sterol-C5(6)-desaturase [Selaginella moellendorffii]XP_024516462.1 delta(7)-sterol-C5(6)-desaturase [Selaginella moellendorffii]EFJ12106.1 hypothetical protein SELMODRAFT_182646 [Selaginella moellendorffii]|eukprot:XP_002986776.1 delta(7)-sterol-C5(6)-desaturase [Selaginella moellendorffii]
MALPLLSLAILSSFVFAASASNHTWSGGGGGGGSIDQARLRLFLEETAWYNHLVLRPLALHFDSMPHALRTWLRNYIAGLIVYFLSGGLWCLYIYWWKPRIYFPNGGIPKPEPIWLQIKVSMKAMPLYTLLPTVSEYMVERGWTKCFPRISDVGFPTYIVLSLTYLVVVEFGIYWMHRGLHDIKPLYKLLHATHHIYNKQDTLSPFAGLAFHPIDGILQALPHVLALFVVPMHFFTHEFFLFLEGIWTTNIHDCIDGEVWPIMGAAYHTIHHTTYKHNYGHYTVWMDWMCGTLNEPARPKEA